MKKRILWFFLIPIFIVAIGYSQSITVTNPHRGDIWYKGSSHHYTIRWTKSGAMNANVKIRLYQGETRVLAITDSTPNDGFYEWSIPESVVNGTYHIRVKTIDNAVYDDGEDFTIAETPSSPATITVRDPHSGDRWFKGQTYTIRWTKSGAMNANVKIRLYQGETKVLAITDSTPNDGVYVWSIPDSVVNGTYHIRVKTVDNAVYDDSDEFSISNTTTTTPIGTMLHELKPHTITVLSFQTYESYTIDSTIRIRWEAKNLTHPIRILLIRYTSGGNMQKVIKDNLNPDIGYYDWNPKRDTKGILPFPDYYIKIEEVGTRIYGVSRIPFELKPEVHVDLSIRLTNERVPYLATDHGTSVILSFRVRDNDPRHGVLRNVPVRVRVEEQVQIKYIRRIQFARDHYEYTVDFTFRLYDRHRSHTVNNTFRVIATVDPQDIYHDDNRLNNTIRFNIIF